MSLTAERRGFIAIEIFKMVSKNEVEESGPLTHKEATSLIMDMEEDWKKIPQEAKISLEEMFEFFSGFLNAEDANVFKKAVDEYQKSKGSVS